jgi:hypothetical protein
MSGVNATQPTDLHIPGLDLTMGALFIGTSVAGVLFGVTCLQTYYYANNYSGDLWQTKALVSPLKLSCPPFLPSLTLKFLDRDRLRQSSSATFFIKYSVPMVVCVTLPYPRCLIFQILVYEYLVSNYARPSALRSMPWSLIVCFAQRNQRIAYSPFITVFVGRGSSYST